MGDEKLGRFTVRQHCLALALITVFFAVLALCLTRNRMDCSQGKVLSGTAGGWVCATGSEP